MPDYDFDHDEQFWARRPRLGQEMVFKTPDELIEAAIEAFDWIHTHPLRQQVVFHARGIITKSYETKMRPFSKHALAMRMGITVQCLDLYRDREGFKEAMAWIDSVIFAQKFEGAAANLLNANFIARDLGMADRSEVTGKDGGPLTTQTVTDEEKLRDEARRLGIPIGAFGLSDPDAQEEGPVT